MRISDWSSDVCSSDLLEWSRLLQILRDPEADVVGAEAEFARLACGRTVAQAEVRRAEPGAAFHHAARTDLRRRVLGGDCFWRPFRVGLFSSGVSGHPPVGDVLPEIGRANV